MKKSSKKSMIGAAVMIAIGFSLIIAGAVQGGFKNLEAEIAKHENLLGPITIGTNSSKGDKTIVKDADFEKSFDAKEVKKLELNIDAAEVIVTSSKDDKITYATKNMKKSEANLDGKTLRLKAEKKNNTKPDGTVYLVIPDGYGFEKLKINIGAGTMTMDELLAEDVNIDLGAGEIEIVDTKAEKIKASIGAGTLVFDNAKVEKIDADVSMGSMEFKGNIEENLKLEVGMGSVEMMLDGSYDDHSYSVETGLGSVSIGGHEFAGVVNVNDDNNTDSEFNIKCGMGSVVIDYED